jgi:predicted RNA-binding protein with PUA domain
MSRHFHYVLVFDEETSSWRVETYEMGDGDIWDNELDEWRWADDEVVEGERDLDGALYDSLQTVARTLAPPIIKPAGQEPDLIYGNE